MKTFLLSAVLIFSVSGFAKTRVAKMEKTNDVVDVRNPASENDCPVTQADGDDFYEAMTAYANRSNCIEAIKMIRACSHGNLASREAAVAAGTACASDNTIPQKIHDRASKKAAKCKKESEDQEGTMYRYINSACLVDSYAELLSKRH